MNAQCGERSKRRSDEKPQREQTGDKKIDLAGSIISKRSEQPDRGE